MKNILTLTNKALVLSLFCGLFYIVSSSIVHISKMNAEVAAEIILKRQANKGPFLNEKQVKAFIASFEGN